MLNRHARWFDINAKVNGRGFVQQKHWIIVVLGIVSLLLAGWAAYFSFTSHAGELIIYNKASEQIVKGELEVCNQHFKFQDINPGESTKIIYKVRSDPHYKITVEFKSGKRMVKELGYVTSGLDFKDTLILQDNDIILK